MHGPTVIAPANGMQKTVNQESLRPTKRLKRTGPQVHLTQEEGDNCYNKGELPDRVKAHLSIDGNNPILSSKVFLNASTSTDPVSSKIIPKTSPYSFGYNMDDSEPFKIHMQQGLFENGVLRRGVEETVEYYQFSQSKYNQPSQLNKNNISVHAKKEGVFCKNGFLTNGIQVCKSDPDTKLQEINYHKGVFYGGGGGLKHGTAAIKLPDEDRVHVCKGEFSESGSSKPSSVYV